MKRVVTFTLASLILLSHTHAQQKKFTLDGSIPTLKAPYVYLSYDAGGKSIKDSSRVINGKFNFSGTVDGPTYSELVASDYNFMNRQWLEPAKMTITQKAGKPVTVTGSDTENDNAVLNKEYDLFKHQRDSIEHAAEEMAKTDSAAAVKQYNESSMAIQTALCARISGFIKAHPHSPISPSEMERWSVMMDLKELQSLYTSLDKPLQTSPAGQNVANQIEIRKRTEIGVTAANFTQKNEKGENIDLASFRGKYVLIDFWASWCGPCRKENPNVVKAYAKYKDKGFEILGVSLDANADKWKDAISKDQLPWAHVSDLKGWQNAVAVQYGIRSVPANFLLDPKGVIIAKNLRGEDLEKKLAELFN